MNKKLRFFAAVAVISTPHWALPAEPAGASAADLPPPEAQSAVDVSRMAQVNGVPGSAPLAVTGGALGSAEFFGENLSLNFQDIEVRAVLQLIADFTGLNLVVSDTVTGRITLRLDDVPWRQALALVLRMRGLDQRLEGDVLLVAPTEEITARERLDLENQRQLAELAPLASEFIQVRYADAADLLALFMDSGSEGSMLSARGGVIVDERTNSVILTDTPRQYRGLPPGLSSNWMCRCGKCLSSRGLSQPATTFPNNWEFVGVAAQ